MKSTMKILAAALLTAFAATAAAQADPFAGPVGTLDKTGANRGQALVASKIASNFERFAGSQDNALALTNALRTGETVKLTYPATTPGGSPTTVTYDPPTGQMGWGNVKISLALAADQLARLGITNPTPEQLQAALNGGSVTVTNANGTTTTTQLRGVVQMRADGMGWGEIAKAGGTKVGPVVSQLKMANTKVATIPPSSGAKGVTTAAGTAATTTAGAGNSGKGLTTAGGAANAHSSRGITTATGATGGGAGQGNAHGRGITTGAGGSGAQVQHGKPAHAGGAGQGLVSGTGGGAPSGITNAGGNSGGHGKGQGGGQGKGKGG